MNSFDLMLKKAWEKYKLKKAQQYKHGESYERLKREESIEFITKHFKSIISIPIVIGVIAAMIMYKEFGWQKLEEVLLSWTIGLTIIATIVTLLERYTKLIKL
ncbi:MAG: hypothetical protein J7K73_00825 [Nanoarchaeota archaeon]|nr:hypothetical protein [Nanoarchaeota archaeon]